MITPKDHSQIKGKLTPLLARGGHESSRRLRFPNFKTDDT